MVRYFLDDMLKVGDAVSSPLLSRGFAFGYGVFETMKFFDGTPCFFDEHLARLQRAIDGAGLSLGLDYSILRERAGLLFEAEGLDSGVFKIVVLDTGDVTRLIMFVRSRGVSENPDHVRLRMSTVVKAAQAFTSRHKTLNYMESVMELEKAKADGFGECVFRNEFGNLTECSVANLFFVQNGSLKTPDLSCGLLDGIVRSKVIAIAEEKGIEVEEGQFTEADLLQADAAFLTSSGNGLRPVESFESAAGESANFELGYISKLRDAFLALERKEAFSNTND